MGGFVVGSDDVPKALELTRAVKGRCLPAVRCCWKMNGAYAAPIVPETRNYTAVRVGTQREENPMGTRLSQMADYG